MRFQINAQTYRNQEASKWFFRNDSLEVLATMNRRTCIVQLIKYYSTLL